MRAKNVEKRGVLTAKFFFQPFRAIAIAARPMLGSVFVAAVSARVRIRDLEQIEVIFPVRSLFFEWRIAEISFHPCGNAEIVETSLAHVVQVLIARDRTSAECAVVDGLEKRRCFARLQFRFDEVAQEK